MKDKIRYAVVGLGHIAQTAMLPGFKHAKNSELTALVSGDPLKLRKFGDKFAVKNLYSYEQFDDCLTSGAIDAVYIALPNSLHQEYAERAARKGIHVLCEKPMAVTEEACRSMIEAANTGGVKLMVAYRLHFEKANLEAIKIAQSGELGDLRFFSSIFSAAITDPGNIRLKKRLGGGTLYDIGIYCINAARYLFRDEPEVVTAFTAGNDQERFIEVEEMASAIMRFPDDRLATFTCGFGTAEASTYELFGTKGSLKLESAYDYMQPMKLTTTVDGKTHTRRFPKKDEFGNELTYFSSCILDNRDPEPSGVEGLTDVSIINALYNSAKTGETFAIEPIHPEIRPGVLAA